MATIQWRPEVNALTTPQSYRARYLPRNVVGYTELAAEIVARNPTLTEDVVQIVMRSENELIQQHLTNGDQVTLEDSFTYRLSITAKLNEPDAPLPDNDDMVKVRVYASKPFVNEVRHAARLERLPLTEKVPVIASAEDNRLKLNDVLNPQGVLKLTGSNLFFDEEKEDGECVIQGTRNGRAVQSQYARISNAEILLVPDIPAQDNPWNNEYTISVTTQYTQHGTPRSGNYRRRLRTPLTVSDFGHPNPPETGILSGNGDSPLVSITGGTASADERLRIQAVFDLRAEYLLISLQNMQRNGEAGPTVPVAGNGEYTLGGLSGSKVTGMNIRVNEYSVLTEMVRNTYSGRLVDILDIRL